ncbi:MAG: FAD-dependent monooxygenase, partial [Chloroflexales bacterium]|nr:FAD-dependent monooxygenase [Chloroflexales bacterium]
MIEKTASYRPIGSMTAMYGEGMAIAERMGLLETLRRHSYRQEWQVLFHTDGRKLRTFNLQRAHALQGGTLTLKRSDWLRVLYQAVNRHVPVQFNTTIRTLQETTQGVDVTLSDETAAPYDLVAGADGIHSAVRRLVFGAGHRRPIGLGVMTFLLEDVGDLLARAQLTPFTVHEWFAPGRYVEVTALAEDVVAGIFVYPSLPGHMVPPPSERQAVLRAQFAAVYGGVHTVIDAVP